MTASNTTMRRFVLVRSEDMSGVSGTGVVCEGVEFSDGHIALHWLTHLSAVAFYANLKVVESIHGHESRTVVKWLD